MVYYVTYRFHVIESLRNESFPKVLELTQEFDAPGVRELIILMNKRLAEMWRGGGIIAPNPLYPTELAFAKGVTPDTTYFDRFMFVPKHLVAYVETVTTTKKEQPPEEPDSGVLIQ